MTYLETLVGSVPKGDGVETRVRRLEVDGETFYDIRDFVVETEVYGRGTLIPETARKALAQLLRSG